MTFEELSDREIQILDLILNLEPIQKITLANFRLHEDITLTSEELDDILNKLLQHQLISIEKKQYQILITLNDNARNIVRETLEGYWKRRNINEKSLRSETEKNLLGILKILEFKYDDKPHIGFSDYFMDSQSVSICDRLTRLGMMFKQTWSSRKHYYQSYYFRKLPFNVERSFEQLIIEKINLKDLEISTDWPILIIATYSEIPLTLEDPRLNIPHLTTDEMNEILFKLEQRGIISRSPRGEVSIPKGIRDMVKNYFLFNQYNAFKNVMLKQLRKRVSIRPSNLFILGLIKRILTSVSFTKTSDPFWSIKRNLIKNVSDDDLKEAGKLGVLFLTSKEIIVAHEALTELESAVKSALMEEIFMAVPPNDNLRAMQAWVQIFGQCKDYVKIMDEYINEETLDIIERFTPPDVSITVLSSIQGSREMDIDEMKLRVQKIKNSGRRINLFFIGDRKQGIAPFHKRYIISRDACYSLSSSIKQVGKSKSVDLLRVPASVKESEIEPAFEYWTGPKKKLEEKGYERMTFDEWIKDRSKQLKI